MTLLLCVVYMLVMGLGIVSMAVLCLRGRKAKYNAAYLVCHGLAILWCASQMFWMLAQTELELKIANLCGNVGICFIGTFWFYFAMMYTEKKMGVVAKAVPAMLSCFHYLMILTNDWHHLYYSSFRKDNIRHALFFYTNGMTVYMLVFLGALIIYRSLSVRGDEQAVDPEVAKYSGERTAKGLVAASVLIPVLLNLCYQTGVFHATFDITPLGFGISAILILLATLRYRFMDVNITAFDTILAGLSDGVGVFDRTGRCTYTNKAFYELLNLTESRGVLSSEDVVERIGSMQPGDEDSGQPVFRDEEGRYLQFQVYQWLTGNSGDDTMEITSLKELAGEERKNTVFVVEDMSRYYKLLHQERELAVINERLALEQERNRIAGQVHDTAGHTLTMIGSYMKLALLAVRGQKPEEVEEYLIQAGKLSGDGIRELRQSINQLRREASYELATQGIMQLADQVKEIAVEVTVQGEDCEKYSHLSGILYDCTRESITNTLKYAQASRMDIIVRFQGNAVELVIGDDGRGCDRIEENNGIRGIRERVEKAGGEVRFQSAAGDGFLTRLRLPV